MADRPEKLVYVDGFAIRNTLDDDFAELHVNADKFSLFFSKPYIPKGEMWIDHIYRKSGEVDLLISVHELIDEYHKEAERLPAESPHKPIEEQGWRKNLLDKMCLPGPVPKFIDRQEKIDGRTISYVDGKVIRQYLDPQFILGGHHLVYSYIPAGEIWLDVRMDERELPFLLAHEMAELAQMSLGKAYDNAHRYATAVDMEARLDAGFAAYPGDAIYPWTDMTDAEIIKKYYVVG